jgi:hypothetical protein
LTLIIHYHFFHKFVDVERYNISTITNIRKIDDNYLNLFKYYNFKLSNRTLNNKVAWLNSIYTYQISYWFDTINKTEFLAIWSFKSNDKFYAKLKKEKVKYIFVLYVDNRYESEKSFLAKQKISI